MKICELVGIQNRWSVEIVYSSGMFSEFIFANTIHLELSGWQGIVFLILNWKTDFDIQFNRLFRVFEITFFSYK